MSSLNGVPWNHGRKNKLYRPGGPPHQHEPPPHMPKVMLNVYSLLNFLSLFPLPSLSAVFLLSLASQKLLKVIVNSINHNYKCYKVHAAQYLDSLSVFPDAA